MTQQQLRGTCLVALSGTLYGMMSYFGMQVMQDNLSVETMLFWRFLTGMVCMLIPVYLKKPTQVISTCSLTHWLKVILFGAISYSACSGFYFLAAKQIGTGLAMVLFFAYPVFVVLFAWILTSWHFNKHTLYALIAVILGLILLKGNGNHAINLAGLCLGIVAALSYAIYVYGSQHTVKVADSRLLTLFICLGNSIIFYMVAKITGTFVWPTSWHTWINILILGLLGTALPIQLLLDGLKYISPIKASILSVLEPVMTVLIGLILLHETISTLQALGVLIVLAGAIFIQFERVQDASQQGG